MPGYGNLDAAWWAALGAPTRWGHTFTGSSHSQVYSPAYSGGGWLPNWIKIGVSLGTGSEFYQAPFLTGESDGGAQMSENNFDTGFFYLTDGHGDDRYPYMCVVAGRPNQNGLDTATMAQCAALIPYNKEGELRPMSDLSGTPDFSAYYKTGFLYLVGSSGSLAYSHTVNWLKCPARGEVVTINHYAPYAWNGTPVETIAAILLQMGLPIAYIDQTAFTNAHGAYESTLGDIPIDGPADAVDIAWFPQVYAVREVGRKVIDLITEVMRHARDLYYTNEAGVMDVSSFTRPTDTVASLTLDDGVLDVEWSWSIDYLFNKVAAGWGSAYRTWGSPADPPDSTGFSCQQEDELDSFQDCKYIHEASNAASVAKYGEIWLKGRKRTTSGSKGKEVESAHYGLFLGPGCGESYWDGYGYGGMMHVTNWLTSDSKERRIVTVVQDMRALDWGIGAQVNNVQVTDDGQTILETRCIERTYDFDRLTVTSVLMELPANT
jgi:hypothetical protein